MCQAQTSCLVAAQPELSPAQVLGQYHLQLYLGAVASKLKSRWMPLAMLPNLSGDTGISRFFLLDPYLETKQEHIIARHPGAAAPSPDELSMNMRFVPTQTSS